MRTARNIISLIFQSIETDIEQAQWAIEYANAETGRLIKQKESCESYLVAESTYNEPLGFYHGIILENNERINALRRRLDYWKSLDERCAEEEKLEEAEEDGEDE